MKPPGTVCAGLWLSVIARRLAWMLIGSSDVEE
jgi:hypothetical protein